MNDIVLIWSDEHKAWWRPDAAGYTTDRDEAGRYWLIDAERRTNSIFSEKRLVLHAASRPETIVERS